jgi:hypothetical protein
MSEVVVVYTDSGTAYYKPMGVTTITAAVKTELDTYRTKDGILARAFDIVIIDGESPNPQGYYTKSQIESIDIDEAGVFVKRFVMGGAFIDCDTGNVVPVP